MRVPHRLLKTLVKDIRDIEFMSNNLPWPLDAYHVVLCGSRSAKMRWQQPLFKAKA